MNHHATRYNPINSRSKTCFNAFFAICGNLPLLLAILFLVSRMGFSFSPSFTNKKRPNRFALHNEVQLRLGNFSFVEMVQQQTISQSFSTAKPGKTLFLIIYTARNHALLNVFYKGSYIEPPQWQV